MRWTVTVVGILSLIIGGIATFLAFSSFGEDGSRRAVRQALRVQVRSVAQELSTALAIGDKLTIAYLEQKFGKVKKVDKSILQRIEAPENITLRKDSGYREYFKKTVASKDLKIAMRKFLRSEEKVVYWEDRITKHSYVLRKGQYKKKWPFVAAYSQRDLFFRLESGVAIRPWVATAKGTVLFHTVPRYVGGNSMNIRPIAMGGESLRKNLRTEMIGEYVGMDGNDVLGAWISLPALGIVVGNEWPSFWWGNQSLSYFTWLAVLGFVFGAFMIGYSVTPRPIQVQAAKREIKDLSEEARQFIKKAENSAEKAYAFAKEREQECKKIEAKAREKMAYVERTRWIFEKTEAFLEEIMEAKDADSVWPALCENLSSMTTNCPVMVYTYSNSSCSLLSRARFGMDEIPESANQYLDTARILVGDYTNVHQLAESAGYLNWKERWERHMPLSNWKFFTLPFASPTGSRGFVLFLLNPQDTTDREIARQRDLWSLFAYRAAWLYDMKKRLLQSKYATKRISSTLANQTNRAPDKPVTTET